MDKMKMESPNLTDANIDKIAALFPNCITETADENGKLKKAINFEMLRAMLSEDIAEGDEAYEFTWVGKKAAIAEANRPIRKTLRPCPEESVNWDTTENLYIEGDNLEVLKLLQESYLGKVKMIYIDPPYNTGHDFVYPDSFIMDNDDYNEGTGYFDEDGNVNYKRENSASAGRYHSDWCSMIYSRLMLARNLLSDDGVIFISMDENEIQSLKQIMCEVFGEKNYVQEIIWNKKFSPQNDAKYFSLNHESIICFAKEKSLFNRHLLPATDEMKARYKNLDNDPRGPWTSGDCTIGRMTEKDYYPIITPSGREVYPSKGNVWRFSKETFQKLIADNRIWFGADGDNMPRVKRFLSETNPGIVPISIWSYEDVGHTQSASQDLKKLFDDEVVFDYPKPVNLIKRCLQIASDEDSIILDFFSGSATTAHAVMQLNAEDGGHRKYIMVQLPEETDEKSEAYKAGYKNICEIGKERIRRAGAKIKGALEKEGTDIRHIAKHLPNADQIELIPGISVPVIPARWSTDESDERDNKQMADKLDIGFRVLKLDETNMEDVFYTPAETTQQTLFDLVSNIKSDRNDLDLLFGCLLDWGLPLSMPYKSEQIDGVTVHTYNDGDLIACFDSDISEEAIRTIAKRQPLRVVFRDDSFASSPSKINVSEIFKMLSPDTRIKVI